MKTFFTLTILLCAVAILPVSAQTIWTGPSMTFTKADGANWLLPANQDRITSNVWITRKNTEGIFNINTETGYSSGVSPAGTEWAFGTTANIGVTFDTWENAIAGNPPNSLNQDMILHIISGDIYIDIKFTSWAGGMAGGMGGFSYIRSTDPTTGISNPDGDTPFQLYPNPAFDRVQSEGIPYESLLSVFDINGKLVSEITTDADGSISVKELQEGIYYVRTSEGTVSKLLKM